MVTKQTPMPARYRGQALPTADVFGDRAENVVYQVRRLELAESSGQKFETAPAIVPAERPQVRAADVTGELSWVSRATEGKSQP